MKNIRKLVRRFFNYSFITTVKVFLLLTPLKKKKKGGVDILTLNTYDFGGGAAKIFYQIFKGLSPKYNFLNLVGYKRGQTETVEIQVLNSRFWNFMRKYAEKHGFLDLAHIDVIHFLLDFTGKAKIIHLHNIHGNYMSYLALPKLFKHKKVIWTLHDEHLISGHCAATFKCEKWRQGCGDCPDLNVYPKVKRDQTSLLCDEKRYIVGLIDVVLVSPSLWLQSKAKLIFPKKRHKHIPNGVDTNIFYPRQKDLIRSKYGIPKEKTIILYAAELGLQNPFKGGEIMKEIIESSFSSERYIITLGNKMSALGKHHLQLPYVSDENEMAELYSLSDIMVYPTKADNFPLVVLESMACGTPVIASKIGGIPEIIDNKKDGYLVDEFESAKEFDSIIRDYIQMSIEQKQFLSIKATEKIQSKFTLDKMLRSYDELYSEMMNV